MDGEVAVVLMATGLATAASCLPRRILATLWTGLCLVGVVLAPIGCQYLAVRGPAWLRCWQDTSSGFANPVLVTTCLLAWVVLAIGAAAPLWMCGKSEF